MAVKPVLDLITQIFGKNALSKTIGTRTNVIRLPDASVKRLIRNELDMARANDSQLETFRKNAEQLIPDIPKMNDQELLTFKGNLQRYYDVMYPPKADVFDFQTRTQVPKAGIEQLEAKSGLPSDVDPNSPLGRIMQRTNKIKNEGGNLAKEFGVEDQLKKGMEGLSTEGGIPFQMGDVKGTASADELFDMITKNPARSGGPLDPNVGIVRTAARQILRKKLDAGEIDIPDAAEKDAIAKGYQGGVDPIEVFRKRFGEDALQDLDQIAGELNKAGDFNEIDNILKRNKLFDIQPKKEYGLDEGVMSDEDLAKALKEAEEPEDFAKGGRVGYAYGSGKKLLSVLGELGKDLKTEIRKAVDNLNPSGDKKVDADMAVDDMLDDLGIDRDEIDGYDILDAYDEAYKTLSVPPGSRGGPNDIAAPIGDIDDADEAIKELKNLGATKAAERFELKRKYPGIDEDLLDKILIDDNPQRKAEVLATLDEAFRMMEKGMGTDEILQTFKKTPRTKQASGGVAYLMGL